MYSIGIITSEYSLHNIMQVDLEMRRRCKITYLPYSSMKHLITLYRENAAFFDGILFSGAFPYHIILEQFGSILRPASYFSISDRDYYRIIAKIAVCSQSSLPLSHVSKIVSLMKTHKINSFTAVELAQYMNLSSRNASRILNALEQGGLAAVYEKRQPGRKGRPAKVYRIEL